MKDEYLLMDDQGKTWTEVILYYRAENGFGGMSKGVVQAKLNQELEVIKIEDVSDIYTGF